MNRLKLQLNFLHALKVAKTQARCTVPASEDDELIKAIVECAINTLNGNHKLNYGKNSKLKKYKNRLRALENPKISMKSRRKVLDQRVAL